MDAITSQINISGPPIDAETNLQQTYKDIVVSIYSTLENTGGAVTIDAATQLLGANITNDIISINQASITESGLLSSADFEIFLTHVNSTNNPHNVTANDVGLGMVDNTSDIDKPISSSTQSALNEKANTASLAPVAFSGDFNDLDNIPTTNSGGASNHSELNLDDGSNPHNTNANDLGLENVDNTSDVDKPISTAQANAIQVVQDDINTHEARTDNPHNVTREQLDLDSVEPFTESTSSVELLKYVTDPDIDVDDPANELAIPTLKAIEDAFLRDSGNLADVYFVSTLGDDASAERGNFFAPYTLQGAIAVVSSGDNIVMIGGDYGDIDFNIAVNGVSYSTFGSVFMTFIDGGGYFPPINALNMSFKGDFNIIINKTGTTDLAESDMVSTNTNGGFFISTNNTSRANVIEVNNINLISGDYIFFTNHVNGIGATYSFSGTLTSNAGFIWYTPNFTRTTAINGIIQCSYTGTNSTIYPLRFYFSNSNNKTFIVNMTSSQNGCFITSNATIQGSIIQSGTSIFQSEGLNNDTDRNKVYADIRGGNLGFSANIAATEYHGEYVGVTFLQSGGLSKFYHYGTLINCSIEADNDLHVFKNARTVNLSLLNPFGVFQTNLEIIDSIFINLNIDADGFSLRTLLIENSSIILSDGSGFNFGTGLDYGPWIIRNSRIEGNISSTADSLRSSIFTARGSTFNGIEDGVASFKFENSTIINNNADPEARCIVLAAFRSASLFIENLKLRTEGDFSVSVQNTGGGITFLHVRGESFFNKSIDTPFTDTQLQFVSGNAKNIYIADEPANKDEWREITANYTALHNDSGLIYYVAAGDITLPDTLPEKWNVEVIKDNTSTAPVNILTSGTNTINGITSINTNYASVKITKRGTTYTIR